MLHHTKYRVLKSSWGIAIDITGEIKMAATGANTILISDNQLTEAEKEQIVLGLQSLICQLEEVNGYYLYIEKVDFNICDFQIDGLYWASRDWLSKGLDIKMPEPKIIFDRRKNKYIFFQSF